MLDHDYKGFHGSFELNLGTLMYEGEVPLVRGCIPFSGINEHDARRRMEAAVEGYLRTCQLEGVLPSEPRQLDAE